MRFNFNTLFVPVAFVAISLFNACKKDNKTTTPAITTYTITTSGALIAASRIEFECNAGIGSAVSWRFGDGSKLDTTWGPGAANFHYYAATGNYTVQLIVNNDSAHAITKVLNIGANYSYYYKGVAIKNDTLFFKFAAAMPPGNTYLWSFGDGAVSAEPMPFHIYTAAGTYNTSVIVNNDSTKYDFKPVTIYNDPVYTHLLSTLRLWHGQTDKITPDNIDTVLSDIDTNYAMTVIDPLTVAFFGDVMTFDPTQSSGSVLFFSANVPSSGLLEYIYFDHVKDSVSYYYKRAATVKYPAPAYTLQTLYHTL